MIALQNNYSKLSLYVLGFVSLLLIYFFVWRTDAIGYGSVIAGDGNDYYSYLMAIFIDHNLGHQNTSPWYVIQTPTGTINVHFVGVSLMLLPFFLIGYAWAQVGGYDINGISEPFQKMISIGALFYAIAGFYFIRKLLQKQGYSELQIALTVLFVFFGTHLLSYTITEPTMSHVYSFALIAAFLYTSYRVFNTYKFSYFIASGILLGLIILVRPINAIILLIIPLWSDSWSEFIYRTKDILWNNKLKILSAVLVFKLTLSIQALIWYFQNGKFLQYTYKDNGLYLFNPSPVKMLFGFNGGLFIYTPLCLLLLLGLIPMYKDQRYSFFVLSSFLLFLFYILSTHWAYTYFDGISIRAFVDFLPVFALCGAALIKGVGELKFKPAALSAITLTALFNLLICYQYKAGIIPAAGMNFEKFKYVLFKTDKKYAGVLGGCNDLRPYAKKHPEVSYMYENTFNETEYFTYAENEFGVEYRLNKLGFSTSKIYVRVKLKRKEAAINNSENALLVLDVQNAAGERKSFQSYKLNDTPASECCEWKERKFSVSMDGKMDAEDKLVVYVWNKEKKEFYIDDFKVEVYNYNYSN